MNNASIYVLCFLGGVLLYLATYHARIVWDDYKQDKVRRNAEVQAEQQKVEELKHLEELLGGK
ncbi:MAG: hypothetical protein Q4B10_08020 [Actinomycetaceae bacterium]|nr:hypothetical protein [Actinomycetaceae bacterium]